MSDQLTTCTKCRIPKRSTDFRKDRRHRNGLHSWCQSCVRNQIRERYQSHPEVRQRMSILHATSRAANPDLYADRERTPVVRARKAAWQRVNRDKQKAAARDCVNKAIRLGRIVRPTHCPTCLEPGHLKRSGASSIEAHHYLGYSREHWLDIKWQCYVCHRKEHAHV